MGSILISLNEDPEIFENDDMEAHKKGNSISWFHEKGICENKCKNKGEKHNNDK